MDPELDRLRKELQEAFDKRDALTIALQIAKQCGPSDTTGRIDRIEKTLDYKFNVSMLQKELDESNCDIGDAARQHEAYYWAKLHKSVPKND